nr:hypothetical protein [Tanacetum cinerariifolium]GEZ71535.1 hypothetical protein [Tanacetum cinerariifolium]
METHDDEARSSRSKCSRQYETVEEAMLPRVHHPFLIWEGCNQAAKSRYNTKLAQLLPRLIYTPCIVHWNVLNHMGCGVVIDEMLTIKLSVASIERTIRYDKMQKNNLWLLGMFEAKHQNRYANVSWLIARWMKRKGAGSQKDSMICCGQALDTTTLRELIHSKGRLIPEVPEPGVPSLAIPKAPRALMQDLYERMGSMEIRQGAIKRMSYRQFYH